MLSLEKVYQKLGFAEFSNSYLPRIAARAGITAARAGRTAARAAQAAKI